MNELLKVDHLTVDFSTDQGTVHAVRDVSFCVYPQEVLGIVGESGFENRHTADRTAAESYEDVEERMRTESD